MSLLGMVEYRAWLRDTNTFAPTLNSGMEGGLHYSLVNTNNNNK